MTSTGQYPDELSRDRHVQYLLARPHLRVVIGGWSASGKTVFARYLAKLLRCEYFSASSALVAALGFAKVDWLDDREQIEARRSLELERRIDRLVMDRLQHTPRIVLDSWVAAFTSTTHDVAVWIECDIETRVRNALGPAGVAASLSKDRLRRVREGLLTKDQDSLVRFQNAYGFEYGPRPEAYPVQIDITGMISAEEAEWAKQRVAVLQALVRGIVDYLDQEESRR